MKCDKCKHKGICKHEDNMKKYDSEIKEKSKLLEYGIFHAEIICEHFYDGRVNLSGRIEK